MMLTERKILRPLIFTVFLPCILDTTLLKSMDIKEHNAVPVSMYLR